MFDPDEAARASGEAHLIPPNVRRLSDDEIHTGYPEAFHEVRGLPCSRCTSLQAQPPLSMTGPGAIEL
jgi:hypothetical protein